MQASPAIYSCDDHLDLSAVPPGLWQSRLAAAHAAHFPHVGAGVNAAAAWAPGGASSPATRRIARQGRLSSATRGTCGRGRTSS